MDTDGIGRSNDDHDGGAPGRTAPGAEADAKQAPGRSGEPGRSAEATVRAYWERVWLHDDLDALDELVSDPTVRHTAEGTLVLARDDLRRRLMAARSAIRANEVSIDALAVDGDRVWARLTMRGVSLATMAPMSLVWIAQYRLEGGRIAEAWTLHQTGVDWSS